MKSRAAIPSLLIHETKIRVNSGWLTGESAWGRSCLAQKITFSPLCLIRAHRLTSHLQNLATPHPTLSHSPSLLCSLPPFLDFPCNSTFLLTILSKYKAIHILFSILFRCTISWPFPLLYPHRPQRWSSSTEQAERVLRTCFAFRHFYFLYFLPFLSFHGNSTQFSFKLLYSFLFFHRINQSKANPLLIFALLLCIQGAPKTLKTLFRAHLSYELSNIIIRLSVSI